MRKPKTLAEYRRLVDDALVEVDEMRNIIDYEMDGASSAASEFLEPLEADLKRLQDALATGTYDFRDEDLPFMAMVSRQSLDALPFKDLLDVINWTHRTGLETGA